MNLFIFSLPFNWWGNNVHHFSGRDRGQQWAVKLGDLTESGRFRTRDPQVRTPRSYPNGQRCTKMRKYRKHSFVVERFNDKLTSYLSKKVALNGSPNNIRNRKVNSRLFPRTKLFCQMHPSKKTSYCSTCSWFILFEYIHTHGNAGVMKHVLATK